MTTSIGFCEKNDASDVMQFIKDHWNEDHILASHKGLFDWQYWDPENGRYNFVLCRRDHDQALLGILGFIPTFIVAKILNGMGILRIPAAVEKAGLDYFDQQTRKSDSQEIVNAELADTNT